MGKVAMMTGKLVEMTTNYETNALNRTIREKAFIAPLSAIRRARDGDARHVAYEAIIILPGA